MENASKALLIAGGILLAFLVLGAGVMLWTSTSNTAESYYETLSETEINRINSYITKYDARTDISAQEIVSVFNYAKEYHKRFGIYIKVTIEGESIKTVESDAEIPTETKLIEFIERNLYVTDPSGNIKTFSCTVNFDNRTESGIIKEVEFKRH